MLIRIAGLLPVTLVNGEGVRYAVFVQGCPHACKGCHNPDTHQFDGGRLMDTAEIIAEIRRKRKLLDGVTLSGGEPMCQPEACKEIADAAHELGLNVWCYTGFTLNALMRDDDPLRKALLDSVDVLVDGLYIEELRSPDLLWRGSKNQRVIKLEEENMTIVRVEDVLELLAGFQRVRFTYKDYSVDADAEVLQNLLSKEVMRGIVESITSGPTIDALSVMAKEDDA